MGHARFYALLKRMPGAVKEDVVMDCSGYTSSLTELAKKPKLYAMMLDAMQAKVGATKQDDAREVKKYRGIILGCLVELGVKAVDGDWSAVNAFVSKRSGTGKGLHEMRLEELKAFNRQVHQIIRKIKIEIKEL